MRSENEMAKITKNRKLNRRNRKRKVMDKKVGCVYTKQSNGSMKKNINIYVWVWVSHIGGIFRFNSLSLSLRLCVLCIKPNGLMK